MKQSAIITLARQIGPFYFSNTEFYSKELNNGRNVFVYGSNTAGIHGAGAAKTALDRWGAIWGQGIGMAGNSYGIPTKDHNIETLPLEDIAANVKEFCSFTKFYVNQIFLVTPIGTGLAGLRHSDMAPLFKKARPENVVFPMVWKEFLVK